MFNRNKLAAFFNNSIKFNENEELLRNSLENDSEDSLKIDVNHLFPNDALPIHYACLYNSLKYFTNPNLPHSQINIPGGAYGSTPMMFTIYNSSYKVLLFLLLNGADISIQNTRSSDVLSFCVRFDDVLGMILILSFIEENISINRYLRYSLLNNSQKSWEFLSKRVNEIEGKDINNEKSMFSLDNIKLICFCISLLIILLYSNPIRLFISICFLLSYPGIASTSLPLIFNILYSIYAYYTVIMNSYHGESLIYKGLGYFIVGIHLLCFLTIFLIKTPYLKINKIKEAKYLLTKMVLNDEYNTDNFCQTCLEQKIKESKHCDSCNKCVSDHIYHFSLLNKCITTKTEIILSIYGILSVLLFTLAIIMNANYEETPFYEFLICLFLFVLSIGTYWKTNTIRKRKFTVETV